MRAAAMLAVALVAGCTAGGDKGGGTSTPEPTPTPSNLIDQVLGPRFAAEGITPAIAGTEEICRRLSADLLGRMVTADEAQLECAGRTVEEIAADFQSRDAYLENAQRFWADRLMTTDVFADWRDLKDLYARLDAMHRDEVPYDAFAIEAMSHPAFVNQVKLPEERAERAFTAFAGRTPTQTEMLGLAALYRPWLKGSEPDPDIPQIQQSFALVDASICDVAANCATDLFGGAELDLASLATLPPGPARWSDLDDAQKDALREPGRLIAAQPFFWDGAADEILNRLLGWSDGGNFPTEPGILLPDVREVLADHLRTTKSIAQAERLVMGSWLYRQTSRVPDDGFGDDPAAPVRPFWADGPRNPVIAEVWMDSAAALTVDLGDCDPRYSDHYQYLFIGGGGPAQQNARFLLWTLQENRTPWSEVNMAPDVRFRDAARTIGGCPGVVNGVSPRQPQTGLAYGFAQESLAEELCDLSASLSPGGTVTVASALEHQTRLAYGRSASAADIADYEAAFASCIGDECTPDGILNQVCVGLLGGAEMIFH